MSDIEIPQLVVREAHIYQIPARSANKGVRAADWDLTKPVFTGTLKVTSIGSECFVKLFDKSTGAEFATCPVDAYPGKAVEPVTDSSRYYILRLEQNGQHAFVGMGFQERSDSFDFNVALNGHFKQEEAASAAASNEPYVAKHATGGLTGSIKINIKKKGGAGPKSAVPTGGLAPPPGGLGASFAAPPGGLGASFPAAAGGGGANPFAPTPAAPTPEVSNPFAPAPAAPAADVSNPFAPAPAAADASNPFATAPEPSNPFETAPAAGGDAFGSFASAPASGGAQEGWVKF